MSPLRAATWWLAEDCGACSFQTATDSLRDAAVIRLTDSGTGYLTFTSSSAIHRLPTRPEAKGRSLGDYSTAIVGQAELAAEVVVRVKMLAAKMASNTLSVGPSKLTSPQVGWQQPDSSSTRVFNEPNH